MNKFVMMDISIIVITRNRPVKLQKCLESILSQKGRYQFEVIVVDNNSDEDKKTVFNRFDKKIILIRNEVNKGVAFARNQGINISSGRYVMMLDDDAWMMPDCVEQIVCFMDACPDSWCAGTKQLRVDGSLEYNARRFYTLKTILLRRTFLGKIFPGARELKEHLYMDWDHNSPKAVDWVAGAGFIMRREAVNQIGSFDENYFFGFEDLDWCYRVKLAGHETYYIPDAKIIHEVQGSSRSFFSESAFCHLRSGLYFWDKFRSGKLKRVYRCGISMIFCFNSFWFL